MTKAIRNPVQSTVPLSPILIRGLFCFSGIRQPADYFVNQLLLSGIQTKNKFLFCWQTYIARYP